MRQEWNRGSLVVSQVDCRWERQAAKEEESQGRGQWWSTRRRRTITRVSSMDSAGPASGGTGGVAEPRSYQNMKKVQKC